MLFHPSGEQVTWGYKLEWGFLAVNSLDYLISGLDWIISQWII